MGTETSPIKGLLLDLDGVFYVGDRLIGGARELVDYLGHSGLPHLYLTNTTTRSRRDLEEKLHRLGLAIGGAQACGIRGILVRTGKYRPELAQATGIRPDHTIHSIARLRDLLSP